MFNLDKDRYFLLLGMGGMKPDGTISIHSQTFKSSETVDLSSFSSVKGAAFLMEKLHGVFMVIAWFLGASFGTYFARYGKSIFQDTKVYGADIWFRAHQVSMSLAVVGSIVGLVLILVEKGLGPLKTLDYSHPAIGLPTVLISFVQPVIAFFRPGKDSPWRPLFKLVHTFLGYGAIVPA